MKCIFSDCNDIFDTCAILIPFHGDPGATMIMLVVIVVVVIIAVVCNDIGDDCCNCMRLRMRILKIYAFQSG